MSGWVDLREFLDGWPYDPENDTRLIQGTDGRQVLQVRLALGVEQYELDGRPDGRRPHGMESLLAFQLERLAQAKAAGQGASFGLNPEECSELFDEAMLYYYRYLHLFQINDWKRTARDTERNLRLFDLAHRYAARPADQQHLEQWRPYILRINAIARANVEWENERHIEAIGILLDAIQKIEDIPPLDDDTFRFERQRSLANLRELVDQFEQNRPLPPLERLERELRQAIDSQQFERAAQLRDQIRAWRKSESAQ